MAKIITIDDELEIMSLIRFVLETDGHSVILGVSYDSIPEQVERQRPDLLISDCLSSMAQGCVEMVTRIRRLECGRTLPILLCTAHGPHELAPLLEAAADPLTTVLYKPFDMQDLIDAVRLSLGMSDLS